MQAATYLYILRECGLPYYKIGLAADPTQRLHQLQTGNSSCIELLGTWPFESREAAKLVETDIHHRHRVARRKGGTEWFHFDDDEIEQLTHALDAKAWKDAVEWDESYRVVRQIMPWIVGAGVVVWTIGREVARFLMDRRKS